jgi:centromere protein C
MYIYFLLYLSVFFISIEVISDEADMDAKDLVPGPHQRKKKDGNVVGRAAQAFNVTKDNEGTSGETARGPSYIMGNFYLPPKGIKDAEPVGPCAQTFTVVRGQKQALEVAYGDPDDRDEEVIKESTAQRFLLNPGSMFRVPPGNLYRLENLSEETECYLTWTIIRPFS